MLPEYGLSGIRQHQPLVEKPWLYSTDLQSPHHLFRLQQSAAAITGDCASIQGHRSQPINIGFWQPEWKGQQQALHPSQPGQLLSEFIS
jgi:hypothetical protein